MPGGTDLGTGYVEVVPSTANFAAVLKTGLSGPLSAAGVSGGASLVKGIEGSIGKIGAAMSSGLGTALAGAGMMAVGAGIQKSLSGATKAAADYGTQVVLLQRMTGANAQESSQWAAVLGRYGIEGKKAAIVIKSLSAAIAAEGTTLKGTAVATKNADGSRRTTMAVMRDLAEEYKNAKDKSVVLTAGTKALGRGFSDLLPVLAGGAAGFDEILASAEKFGLILTQDNIDAFKAYAKAAKDNEQSTKGMAIQIGLATLPFETFKANAIGGLLNKLHEVNPELVKFGGGAAAIGGPLLEWGGKAMIAVAAFPYLKAGLVALKTQFAGEAVAAQSASASTGMFGDLLAGEAVAADTAAVSTAGFGASVAAVAWPLTVVAGAAAALYFGVGTLVTALNNNAGYGAQTEGAKAMSAAESQAAASARDHSTALVGLHQHQSESNADFGAGQAIAIGFKNTHIGLAAAATGSGAAMTASAISLTAAQIAQKSAELDLADAQGKLSTLIDEGTTAGADYERAQLGVATAQNTLRDATKALEDAQKSLNGDYLSAVGASMAATKADADQAKAKKALAKAVHDHGAGSKQAKAALEAYNATELASAQADDTKRGALSKLSANIAKNGLENKSASQQQKILGKDTYDLAVKFNLLAGYVKGVPNKKQIAVNAATEAAKKNVQGVKTAMDLLHDKHITVSVGHSGISSATWTPGKGGTIGSIHWNALGNVFKEPTVIGIGDSPGGEVAQPLNTQPRSLALLAYSIGKILGPGKAPESSSGGAVVFHVPANAKPGVYVVDPTAKMTGASVRRLALGT